MSILKSILVVGATGKQGGALITSLLATPDLQQFHITALTRDANSASSRHLAARPNITILEGNLDDCPAIFSKIKTPLHAVFSVTTPIKSAKLEEQQGKDLIDAAASHGVKHFVFTSADRGGPGLSDRDPSVVPHFASKFNIEKHLDEVSAIKGMGWTTIRPVAFMENLTPDFIGKAFSTMWKQMGEDKKLQLVSSADVGKLAAMILRSPEDYFRKSISFATDELSWKEANQIFKRVVGTELPLTYGWIGSMIKLLLHEQLGIMFKWFVVVGFGADPKEFIQKVPELLTFEKWLRVESKFKNTEKR